VPVSTNDGGIQSTAGPAYRTALLRFGLPIRQDALLGDTITQAA
jgi:hypothetical protein